MNKTRKTIVKQIVSKIDALYVDSFDYDETRDVITLVNHQDDKKFVVAKLDFTNDGVEQTFYDEYVVLEVQALLLLAEIDTDFGMLAPYQILERLMQANIILYDMYCKA